MTLTCTHLYVDFLAQFSFKKVPVSGRIRIRCHFIFRLDPAGRSDISTTRYFYKLLDTNKINVYQIFFFGGVFIPKWDTIAKEMRPKAVVIVRKTKYSEKWLITTRIDLICLILTSTLKIKIIIVPYFLNIT